MNDNYDFKGKRILIVDDEETNWLLLKDSLEETHAEMQWARIGQEAIDLIASGERYDIILMDIRMPIIDGFEATIRIKKLNKNIPIIAQTAFAIPEEQTNCIEAGCDDYISKPIEIMELLKIIDRYIKKA